MTSLIHCLCTSPINLQTISPSTALHSKANFATVLFHNIKINLLLCQNFCVKSFLIPANSTFPDELLGMLAWNSVVYVIMINNRKVNTTKKVFSFVRLCLNIYISSEHKNLFTIPFHLARPALHSLAS